MPTSEPRDPTHGPSPGQRRHATTRVLGPRADYRPMMPVTDPDGRIVFGMVILLAALWGWWAPTLGRLSYWMLFIALFGVAMIRSGILQQRHQARVQREVQRADAEWPELLRAAAAARHRGESIARLLLQRGYRDHFVRHWIAHRLEDEL